MMSSRRTFLAATAAAAPAILHADTRRTFEENVRKMSGYVKAAGRAFRPHAKTHKCPEIGKQLIRAGATGACAAKISEAEALAAGGVTGLLLTSAMIGPVRIQR